MADDQKLIKEISKYSDQIGGYAAKYSSYNKFFKTDFATSCDGVGTKILLAQIAKSFYSRPLTSIGIDCVAMVVNDLLCKVAIPKFLPLTKSFSSKSKADIPLDSGFLLYIDEFLLTLPIV